VSAGPQIETGRTGRIVYARVRPNEDLVLAVEKICLREGLGNAFLRGSLGSLTDACLVLPDGTTTLLKGPAIEVVSMSGEVRADASGSPEADLCGMVCTPDGVMTGGRFLRGQNPVCVTFEIALEEWVPDDGGADAPSPGGA